MASAWLLAVLTLPAEQMVGLKIVGTNMDLNFEIAFSVIQYCFPACMLPSSGYTLQLRHNGRDGVSNHHTHHCLLNRLFRRRSKKTSNSRVTGLCAGNSPVTGEFPAQMASNAEKVSIWCRYHDMYRRPDLQTGNQCYPNPCFCKLCYNSFIWQLVVSIGTEPSMLSYHDLRAHGIRVHGYRCTDREFPLNSAISILKIHMFSYLEQHDVMTLSASLARCPGPL